MEQREKKYIAPEDYLEAEASAEVRSEYYHGETFVMTGSSFNHNLIAANVSSFLHMALRESGCFALSADMKVQVDAKKHYTYPDIAVICGEVEFAEGRNDVVKNPVVIVEILSESTKDYDRGTKFTAYREIESLEDYILIDQYDYRVEHFHKKESGQWVLDDHKRLEDSLAIRSVELELPLATIYDRLDLGLRRTALSKDVG